MILCMPNTSDLEWIGSGVECKVWSWNGGTEVLKTFGDEYEATDAMEQQDEAYACGLAPYTGGQVFPVWCYPSPHEAGYDWVKPEVRYAYVSEWVDPDHGCHIDVWEDDSDAEYWDLIDELRANGISTGDLHQNNVGRTSDGRLVRIDFGGAST